MAFVEDIDDGLSPRVRGNPTAYLPSRNDLGSIPARAGEPYSFREWRCSPRVYPRACGGTSAKTGPSVNSSGLSPRVRGNLGADMGRDYDIRSIPARAGEPSRLSCRRSWTAVYPRACGGTYEFDEPEVGVIGLSPRVRGNPHIHTHTPRSDRSIPARAGEPGETGRWGYLCRVYPRACGGTDAPLPVSLSIMGLSPRVRGNPLRRSTGH